jgi:hypothetical protein
LKRRRIKSSRGKRRKSDKVEERSQEEGVGEDVD